MRGYNVPIRIVIVEVIKNILFKRSPVSFENIKYFVSIRWVFLNPYISNGIRVDKANMIRINTPLVGSEAKAWTEVNSPDLTINVPNKEKEKPKIASNMVQL